jgi:hypothetical protein
MSFSLLRRRQVPFIARPIRYGGSFGTLLVPNREEYFAGVEAAPVRRLGNVDDLDFRVGGQQTSDTIQYSTFFSSLR